jgi:hypothetical protein
MEVISISQISDPNKQQPFTGLSLEFLQNALRKDDAGIIETLVTKIVGSYSLTVPYVISGCVVTDSNKDVTAGKIFYGGKFYETTSVNGTTNVARFILTKTQDATADPVTFSDASIGSVHDIYKYVPTDVASGGDFTATDLVYLATSNSKDYANKYFATGFTVSSGTYTLFTDGVTPLTYTTPNDGITRLYKIEYKGIYVTSSGVADSSARVRIRNTTASTTLDEGRVGKSNFDTTAVPTGSVYLNTGVISILPNTTINIEGQQVADNTTFEFNRLIVTEL